MSPINLPLSARDYCGDDPNCLNPTSPWYAYGRWILLACIIALAIIIFVIFSFVSARRRRRLGDNPLPLTGWARAPNRSQWEQGYKNEGGNGGLGAGIGVGAQQRAAQAQGEGWDSASDFGTGVGHGNGLGNGVVKQPEQVHGGEQMYAPPAGPPPGKN